MPPGRPKKDVVQSPSQDQNNSIETTNQEKNLTHEAFSIFKGKDGWYVASIKYNPETGDTGEFTSKCAGPSKDFSIEAMKIDIANSLL